MDFGLRMLQDGAAKAEHQGIAQDAGLGASALTYGSGGGPTLVPVQIHGLTAGKAAWSGRVASDRRQPQALVRAHRSPIPSELLRGLLRDDLKRAKSAEPGAHLRLRPVPLRRGFQTG